MSKDNIKERVDVLEKRFDEIIMAISDFPVCAIEHEIAQEENWIR